MTERNRTELKHIIIEKIKDLNEEIAGMEINYNPIAPDNAYGRLSRMEAIGSKAISDAGLRDKKVMLQRLGYALSICDTEMYGKCSKCREDISHPRLAAVPYAALCIKCAQKR